jgi:hypothetical protein
MKSFKKLSLTLLLVAIGSQVWADDYYARVTVKASPTGAGKVYAVHEEPAETTALPYDDSFTTGVNKSDEKSQSVYLYAQPVGDNQFLGWFDASDNMLGVSNPYKAVYEVKSTTETKPDNITYTAKFGTTLVTVGSSDAHKGSASIDKPENNVNEQVTLTAATLGFGSVFAGWSIEGSDEIVSTANPYTFTVQQAGKYIAHFKPAHYYRLFSRTSKKYLFLRGTTFEESIKSQDGFSGAIFFNSLVLYQNEPSTPVDIAPETIFYISGTDDGKGGLDDMSLICQNVDTKEMMKKTGLADKLVLRYDANNKSFKAYVSIVGSRFLKDGAVYGGRVGNSAIICGGDDNNQWELQPLTEETMDQFYFGAKPSATMNYDDKYWTTMYTSFPYQCKDGVEAYYVASITKGESTNYANLAKIASGLVPANTAVVLACQTTEAKTNRLVPYEGTVDPLTDNLLKGSYQLNGEEKITYDGNKMRVLNKSKAGVIGFYKLAEGTEMKANKAWLDVSGLAGTSAAKPMMISFGNTPTGIKEVSDNPRKEVQDENYYDLQGRRVQNPVRGIYIYKGKKIIIR